MRSFFLRKIEGGCLGHFSVYKLWTWRLTLTNETCELSLVPAQSRISEEALVTYDQFSSCIFKPSLGVESLKNPREDTSRIQYYRAKNNYKSYFP